MVSVIIPAFNRENTIEAAVRSVLDQTWKDLEVIVVDDGSTDATKEVVSNIKDTRLKYVYQNNAGACAARNRGIDLAQGEYIAFHDSDDLWRKNKLERQMRVFVKTDADIVYCRLLRHFPDNHEALKPEECAVGIVKPIVNLFGIGTQTIVGKSSVFKKYKFDVSFPRFQEFEMLYRATKEFSLYCVDEALVDYYVGDDSISSSPEKLYIACNLLLEKHPEIVREYPVMGKKMAHYLLTDGNNVRKTKGDWKKYLRLSNRCSVDIRLLVKEFFIIIGVYSYITKK